MPNRRLTDASNARALPIISNTALQAPLLYCTGDVRCCRPVAYVYTWRCASNLSFYALRCFTVPIFYGHAICISPGVVKIFHPPDPSGEPTPAFASDAEIELAEQLRHQLEARLLEASAAPPFSNNASAETTDANNSSTR